MSQPPHRGCWFNEQGVAPPAWLQGFDFIQKDVSKSPRCQGLQQPALGEEGCKTQAAATALLALGVRLWMRRLCQSDRVWWELW